ncbi:hypothetical protein Droror1_Dr00014531 [Drosera rotundifolia]
MPLRQSNRNHKLPQPIPQLRIAHHPLPHQRNPTKTKITTSKPIITKSETLIEQNTPRFNPRSSGASNHRGRRTTLEEAEIWMVESVVVLVVREEIRGEESEGDGGGGH